MRRALATCAMLAALSACAGNADEDDDQTPPKADADTPGEPDAALPDAPLPPDAPPADPCGGVTSRCTGSTLETCVNGELQPTDCAASNQECREDGSGGFGCFDPVAPGTNNVSGTVRYEDREPQPSGALGSIRQMPARGVTVTVVKDQGSTVLATGRTDDQGHYSLSFEAAAGTMVHVLAATTSSAPERPVKVTKRNNNVHGAASTSFAAAASTQKDVLATEASHLGGAFNVFDQMIDGIDAVHVRMGIGQLQPLKAIWENGSQQGTYYDGSLNLLGGPDDDDGYDDAVILHEFGHYVEGVYGGTDSPGGGHDGSPADPRLGWSEGQATYFSSAVRNNHYYMDSNSGGGFGDDLEGRVTKATATGPMTQNVSENMVAQILWDIGDGPASDDDARTGGDRHEDVMKIENEYLANGITSTRGVQGVDLVDWLDGWFKLRGLSTCAAVRSILQTHTFPYDFHAPGANCP
jgi:hypothetical protein